MESVLAGIEFCLLLMLLFKDMSGKNELRGIREELEKMNRMNSKRGDDSV